MSATSGQEKDGELFSAIMNKDAFNVVRELRHGANPNAAFQGAPLLCHACERGSVEIVASLLGHGARVSDRVDNNGATALFLAMRVRNKHDRENIMDLLLEHGCDIDALNSRGESAIEVAVKLGDLESAAWLAAKGASCSFCDLVGILHQNDIGGPQNSR